MIGKIFVRKADEKGRVMIAEYKRKEVYIVDLGSGYFVTDKKDVAEKVSENSANVFSNEFLRLVEEIGISENEINDILEKEITKKVHKIE